MATPFRDAQQALGFVVSQTSNIETRVYAKRYPNYDYASLVPVVTEGNEWARTTTFYSSDGVGASAWINGGAGDMPYADINRDKHEQTFAMRGIGYEWNLEELNVARMVGQNLADDKAATARRIAESFLFRLALTGESSKGWTGLFNDAAVTAADVAADGTGSSKYWTAKTADLILRDINDVINGIQEDTLEVEMANTLVLPTTELNLIANKRLGDNNDTTVLDYLRKNNVYTQTTGQPLMIRGNRLLSTAGTGGVARGVAYWRDPEAVRFHLPMPFRFLAPYQKSSMGWEVAGIMRTGGTEIRLPGAVRYFDEFAPAPS
jgi:hypothetical protein